MILIPIKMGMEWTQKEQIYIGHNMEQIYSTKGNI